MSTSQPTNDDSQRLEQIVAYLDGELLPEESAQVEQLLASDDAFRHELQSIDRAWAALDELPATEVDDKFSKTTMELVVDDARREIREKTQALPIQRRKQSVATVLFFAAATLLGGLAFRLGWQNPNRWLLADLPVIHGIDVYSQFRDIEFLRYLQRALGETSWSTDAQEVNQKVEQFRIVASPETGQHWLENIAEDQRVALRAKYNRFRALSEERREQLRQLHQQVESADDSSRLQQTMFHYLQWLNGLPASQQYELRELSAQQRARRVARMVRQQVADETFNLTPEQLRTLFKAVWPQMQEIREQTLERMSPQERERFERLPNKKKRANLFWMSRVDSKHRAEEIHRRILASLPEDKRDAFQQLSLREKWERFHRWMRQAVVLESTDRLDGPPRRPGEVTENELEEFFAEQIDAATKERLLALPREKMQQQLKLMYRGSLSHGGWKRPADPGGPPPRRPGYPRPGGARRGSDSSGRPHFRDHRPPPKDA